MKSSLKKGSGFTIVELLVVIVVIAILAAITIVSYGGITQKATISSIQSDLVNGSNKLKMYQVENGSFPTSFSDTGDGNYCPTPVDTKYCLKITSGNTFVYSSVSSNSFHLTATKNNESYSITDSTSPAIATTTASCPTGYIPVPGSGTYGTNDFCVMKYEAKNVSGVATSQAAGTPWSNIYQTDAATTAAAACTGCHLITEAEWMTIVQNAASVPGNWNTGTIGSGYIYSGHNDMAPANTLEADTNDSNGYYGETNTGGNQRRTLTLTNGQVIWDLAGNISEWISDTPTGGQPGVPGGGYVWREYSALTNLGTFYPKFTPSATGISGSSSWSSSNGIGQVRSNADETQLRGVIRGGDWSYGANGGIFSLSLYYPLASSQSFIGFRVAK